MKYFILITIWLLVGIHSGCVAQGDGSKTEADTGTVFDVADDALALDTAVLTDTDGSQDSGVVADTAGQDLSIPTDAGQTEVTAPQDSWTEPDVVADSTQPLPSGLKGEAPSGDTALPQFSAVLDQDGNSVGPGRLVGAWSVLWFYPIASTAG